MNGHYHVFPLTYGVVYGNLCLIAMLHFVLYGAQTTFTTNKISLLF